MKTKWLMSVLIIALVMVSGISCHCEDNSMVFPRETSLKEAGKVLGVEIPRPAYLPEGYKTKEVILQDKGTVLLKIRNEDDYEIELRVDWGIVPVRGLEKPKVDINGTTGYLFDDNKIMWNLQPATDKGVFVLTLSAGKGLPTAELLLTAKSVGW